MREEFKLLLSQFVSDDDAEEILKLARDSHTNRGIHTRDFCGCGSPKGSYPSTPLCRLISNLPR